MQPIVWTIAGSDSSGLAGLQADLKTFHHLGVHGCSIVSAVTSQHSHALSHVAFQSADTITSQMEVMKEILKPSVVKIGMLGSIEMIEAILPRLSALKVNIVLDPVFRASSGPDLVKDEMNLYLSHFKKLISIVDIITPNLNEAAMLVGYPVDHKESIERAARDLLLMGAKNVCIKGGHNTHDLFSQDYFTNGRDSFWLSSQRYPKANYRGTGCVFASAIASALALNYEIEDALVIAKMVVSRAIRLSSLVNESAAKLHHDEWPDEQIDLPYLTHQPLQSIPSTFPNCGDTSLGLYPVVDSFEWVKKLLPMGVTTIQLRIKDKAGVALEEEIAEAVHFAKSHNARLFINDHWQLAVKYRAYGVHLGQEDLNDADVEAIKKAGLRLGISTHAYYEVARAHAYHPSYMACGPIYATTSKVMPFQPQGVGALTRWRTLLSYPLVAIGGIDLTRIDEVKATGVDGIAMISAITKVNDPIATTNYLLQKVNDDVDQTRLRTLRAAN